MTWHVTVHGVGSGGRYMVAVGPEECEMPEKCSSAGGAGHARVYYAGDDLKEAERVFHRLERTLVLGGVQPRRTDDGTISR